VYVKIPELIRDVPLSVGRTIQRAARTTSSDIPSVQA
jgi:hypothetical protein